jgi:ribosomal-protein-alanine N-acetyltransferase
LRGWYIIVAQGGSLYRQAAHPWLSKLETHYFLNPPPGIASARAAFWYAYARAQTDNIGVARYNVHRATSADDLARAEDLQRDTFTNPWGAEAIRWELENTDVARLYLMSAASGELVAYCACWMIFDELHINSLAVGLAWRRRGVARQLLQHVFRDAVGAGARAATLEVRQSNQAARGLYEGLGFAVEGVRRDYYQHPREDALILWQRRLADGLVRP